MVLERKHFEAPPTAACWQKDGEALVVGSLDSSHALEVWSIYGDLMHSFVMDKETVRIYDLALSPDGKRLVAISENMIYVYDYITRERLATYHMKKHRMTSIAISQTSEYMLVSLAEDSISLMSIANGEQIRMFKGHKHKKFMIRSSFGGAAGTFVVSGSEGLFISAYRVQFSNQFRFDNLHLENKWLPCRYFGAGRPSWFAWCCKHGLMAPSTANLFSKC